MITKEIISLIQPLIYYSQLHTIKGVSPAGMPTHEDAWKAAQLFLNANTEVIDGQRVPKDETYLSGIEIIKKEIERLIEERDNAISSLGASWDGR